MNWIVAAWVPRVRLTRLSPSDNQNSVFLNSLRSIDRATRKKTTRARQERRYKLVVRRQDKGNDVSTNSMHYFRRPLFSMRISRISLSTSYQERLTASFLAIMSTSWLGTIWWRCLRKHSLRSRFTRLRTTAFPTFELTVTLHGPLLARSVW